MKKRIIIIALFICLPLFCMHDIHEAALSGDIKSVQACLDLGIDVNIPDFHWSTPRGRGKRGTPLHMAAEGGHEAVVRLLVDKGAYVDARDNCERTPIYTAIGDFHRSCKDCGHKAVVRLLVDAGADINAQDCFGMRPLEVASDAEERGIVQLLINAGADVDVRDRQGCIPYRLGNPEITRLLILAGMPVWVPDFLGTKAHPTDRLKKAIRIKQLARLLNGKDGLGAHSRINEQEVVVPPLPYEMIELIIDFERICIDQKN